MAGAGVGGEGGHKSFQTFFFPSDFSEDQSQEKKICWVFF